MSRIVVLFKSKYGSSKRYAEWIAEEVGADLYESTKVTVEDLLGYDTIVFGGSLYAVGILGFSLIKQNFSKIKEKKLIVFTVGASPAHPQAVEEVKNQNFTNEMKDRIQFFHLRGSFDYKKLNPMDKVLMLLLKWKIKHKKGDLTKDEIGMLACYDHPADWTSKKNIGPIVQCIRQ